MSISTATAAPVSPVGRDDQGPLLREVLDRIGDKWTVIVICRLDAHPWRFNELRRRTEGINQRMLSATLHRLERDGLVSRTVFPTVPPGVEYALTDSGGSLHGVVHQLVDWTDQHLADIQRSRAVYDASRLLPEQEQGERALSHA